MVSDPHLYQPPSVRTQHSAEGSATERDSLVKLRGSLRGPVSPTRGERNERDEAQSIFARRPTDIDDEVLDASMLTFSDPTPLKHCRRLVEGAQTAALCSLIGLMAAANVVAFRETDVSVLTGALCALAIWVFMVAVPLAADREFKPFGRTGWGFGWRCPSPGPSSAARPMPMPELGWTARHLGERRRWRASNIGSLGKPKESEGPDSPPRGALSRVDPEAQWGLEAHSKGSGLPPRVIKRASTQSHIEQSQLGERACCAQSQQDQHGGRRTSSADDHQSAGDRESTHGLPGTADALLGRRRTMRNQNSLNTRQWAEEVTKGDDMSLRHRSVSVIGQGSVFELLLSRWNRFASELKSALLRSHDSPDFWVGRAIRTIVYAFIYVFGTYYLSERDYTTGYWDFENVPAGVHLVIQISVWTTLFDYVFETFSGGGFKFILSNASFTM
ncbi:hypothetical protein T492DRAFT_1063170, partial [Pavlovales sp. CCMP2436]